MSLVQTAIPSAAAGITDDMHPSFRYARHMKITRQEIGYNPDYNAWRFDFLIQSDGFDRSIPILISDDCPEEARPHQANDHFRAWVAMVAEEAAEL